MDGNAGVLLVMMEPAAGAEDEFNDWYDTEHFPQRRNLPGFETASRWVCLAGWPRYAALYDLTGLTVLESEAYKAVSGANATPWSKRVLPRTIGRLRVVAEQVSPGREVSVEAGVSRLLVARFQSSAYEELVAPFGRVAGLTQVRAFAETIRTAWVIAAFDRLVDLTALADIGGRGADVFNFYSPYWRG